MRILIIEDEKQNAELYKEYIEYKFKKELTIDIASDPSVISVTGKYYDIIITDYSVLDNKTKKIMKDQYVNNLIIFSGHDNSKDTELAEKYIWLSKQHLQYFADYIDSRLCAIAS